MIIVNIRGGIASQLHKYAVARAVSLKYSMPLFLDLSWFESTPECDTQRVFRLNEFSTHYEIASKEQIEQLTGPKALIRVKDALFNRFGINLHKRSYVTREPWSLPSCADLKKGLYLAGEWGGDKYFSDIKDILVNEFKPARALSETARVYLQEINKYQSVSIHIRRGDYLSNINAAKLHAICDKGYYAAATELMSIKIKSAKCYLFSDEKQEALKILEGLDVTLVEGISDVEEFYIMSQCKHNICANSAFSYLAAWIGKDREKVVISPKKWVKDPVRNSQIFKSFYCDGWIYIDN